MSSSWKEDFEKFMAGKAPAMCPICEPMFGRPPNEIEHSEKWRHTEFSSSYRDGGFWWRKGYVKGPIGIEKAPRGIVITLLSTGQRVAYLGSAYSPLWWWQECADQLMKYAISPDGELIDQDLIIAILKWFEKRIDQNPKPKRGDK